MDDLKSLEAPIAVRITNDGGDPYTACDKWEYRPLTTKLDHKQSWINLAASFYRGGHALIEGVVKGNLYQDVEGPAGIFLFRHYLELILKELVFWGRALETPDMNKAWEEVEAVKRIHGLAELWNMVIRDAKPKISAERWNNFDIPFAEKVIDEFAKVDPNGFAFRYEGQGGQEYGLEYPRFLKDMDHVRQVLESISSELRHMYIRNDDWEEMQRGYSDIFVDNV